MPQFGPRSREERKSKVRSRLCQRSSHHATESLTDPNATEILPAARAEREEKKRKLRAELSAQQPKMSRKKQRRLEKYIEIKLKKEENLELIKKISQARVDTSLLQSTKTLGRITESKRDALDRARREKLAGIDVEKNENILESVRTQEERRKQQNLSYHTDSEDEELRTGVDCITSAPAKDDEAIAHKRESLSKESRLLGIGLKRPLELDENGRPIIKKRRRTRGKPIQIQLSESSEWEGFSSENDTSPQGSELDSQAQVDEGGEIYRPEVHKLSESENDLESEDSSTSTEEEEETDLDSSSHDEDSKVVRKSRSSAFKAWATQQRNEALGFRPSTTLADIRAIEEVSKQVSFTPRPIESDSLPPELEHTMASDATRKVYAVAVDRSPEIQEARLALPVVAEEQKIMEAIHNNDIVVVCGETGSGKTTQVPQFLYEAGYGDPSGPTPGMVGVTQPRRIAAVSMADRVGDELGAAKKKVSYQIRFERSGKDENTAIKFMTDGILLREIGQDFALTKYSAIVIDEAHERSVNTDILIGIISRIADLRKQMAKEDTKAKPLKVVIMSATLRISDFTQNQRLFRKCRPPLVEAEGRQHPVTIHFSRKTRPNYLEEAFRKIFRGHKKLPPGGMLVFLTGQNEIVALSKRLKRKFNSTVKDIKYPPVQISAAEAPLETEDLELGSYDALENRDNSEDESEIWGLDDDESDKEFDIAGVEMEKPNLEKTLSVHVLPLYSQLPTNQQLRVFQPPPDGSRLIVLATNVAETSLTIPGIRYVFDCGRSKERKYDRTTGVQSFEICWISKASANQRAGRAGRIGPGHCYRLYSSAVYERDFEEYSEPEILRTPVEGVVLQLKSMELHQVVNFPFPTPPDRQSLAKAERLLTYLGALDGDGRITKLGRELAVFPLSPRLARMIVISLNQNFAFYGITLVAALAIPELFIPENQLDLKTPELEEGTTWTETDNHEADLREQRRRAYNRVHKELSSWSRTCDALKFLQALCEYRKQTLRHPANTEEICSRLFLRPKAMKEAAQLCDQIAAIVRAQKPGELPSSFDRIQTPDKKQLEMLKQLVAAGFIDQVAVRADKHPAPPPELTELRKPRRAIDVPYIPLFRADLGRGDEASKFIYIHPGTVLANTEPVKLPQYLVYSHLQRSSSRVATEDINMRIGKIRMFPLTPVTKAQLLGLARNTPLLDYGKPVKVYGGLEKENGYERRECLVVPMLVGEKGAIGWPLVPRRVVQKRVSGKGWAVEKEMM